MATLEKIAHNATRACAPVGDARDQLRGDGILLDGHVARHQADMESVVSYEGTDAPHGLIWGEITGVSAALARLTGILSPDDG